MTNNSSKYSFSNSLKSSLSSLVIPQVKSAVTAPPAVSGSYKIKSGDNLSTIASRSGMTLQSLLALNPQFQSNPNLIHAGQTVNLSVAPKTAPVAPVVPQANQQGALTPPPAPGTATRTPGSAPGATSPPGATQVSPEATKALGLAQSAYEQSQKISPEALSTQEDIDKLLEQAGKIDQSRRLGLQATSEQPIAMEFITGQQRAIENRALNEIYGVAARTEPLERKLGRLQTARTSSLEASKFALDRADKAVALERSTAETARTEAESARRFGVTTGLTTSQQAQQKLEADRKFAEDKRQFGLEYANKQRKVVIKEKEPTTRGADVISPYQVERGRRNLQSVDELLPRVSKKTVGIGSYANLIRGTDAYNFKSDLDMLKSNIAFGELTAMREASKTGGALGQISDRENQLLAAALGSIDPGQSPEQFTKNLNKIKDSINRWYQAVGTSTSSTGGSTFVGSSGTTYKLPY